MKRILALLIAFCLTGALCGCSSDSQAQQSSEVSEYSFASRPKDIKLKNATIELHIKSSEALEVIVDGAAANPGDFYYSSSDSGIATVDGKGQVTGVSEGNASIEISSKKYPGLKTIALINVYEYVRPVYSQPSYEVSHEESEESQESRESSSLTSAGVEASEVSGQRSLNYSDLVADVFGMDVEGGSWYALKEKNFKRANAAREYLITYEIPMDAIEKMNKKQVNFMLNVLAASNGRKFDDRELNTFFNSLLWYQEMSDGYKIGKDDTDGDYKKLGDLIHDRMSSIEKVNDIRLGSRQQQFMEG